MSVRVKDKNPRCQLKKHVHASQMPSKSPLSEKLHAYQPCSFYLLRQHLSLIISVCQDKELENIYILKSLRYQIGLKHKMRSGYQLLLNIRGDMFCARLLAPPPLTRTIKLRISHMGATKYNQTHADG